MNIILWNVNGIRSILRKDIIHDLNPNTDIVCFVESRHDHLFKNKVNDIAKTYGYKYSYLTESSKSGYAGILLWSKIRPKRIIYDFDSSLNVSSDIESIVREGRVITLIFKKISLVVVYTPNSGSKLLRLNDRTKTHGWDHLFSKHINQIKHKYKNHVMVAGDLNCAPFDIDVYSPKTLRKKAGFTSLERSSFQKLLSRTDLLDGYRELHPNKIGAYTYWDARNSMREVNKGWRIDHFLLPNEIFGSNNKNKSYDIQILSDIFGSDHAPVLFTWNVDKNTSFGITSISNINTERTLEAVVSDQNPKQKAIYHLSSILETYRQEYKKELRKPPETGESSHLMYKLSNLRKVITRIREMPETITIDDLKDVKGVGPKTFKMIEDALSSTKSIRSDDDEARTIHVHGIGPELESILANEFNVHCISDLKQKMKSDKKISDLLPYAAKVGLKHHDNITRTINRSLIRNVELILRDIGVQMNSALEVIVCGSYRRGKQICKDIDVLLIYPKLDEKYLINFITAINRSSECPFELIHFSKSIENIQHKYLGLLKYKNDMSYVRIDIICLPNKSKPTALAYFTGSADFNIKMRKIAHRTGFKLNQYGLFKRKDTDDRKYNETTVVSKHKYSQLKLNSEEDLFDKLGIDYVLPINR